MVRCVERKLDEDIGDKDCARFAKTMKAVFREINRMRREALKEFGRASVGSRVEREKNRFVADNPQSPSREEAAQFLRDLAEVLDDTSESDDVSVVLNKLRREYALDRDLHLPVPNYEGFKDALIRVRYAPELAQVSITARDRIDVEDDLDSGSGSGSGAGSGSGE